MRDIASLVSLIVVIVAALGGALAPPCARRAALLLGAGRRHHQLVGANLVPLYEQKNIKISRRCEIASNDLNQDGRLASKRGRTTSRQSQAVGDGVVDPIVWVAVRIAGTICARRELTCGRPHGSLVV